jgi:hypothetical protein
MINSKEGRVAGHREREQGENKKYCNPPPNGTPNRKVPIYPLPLTQISPFLAHQRIMYVQMSRLVRFGAANMSKQMCLGVPFGGVA